MFVRGVESGQNGSGNVSVCPSGLRGYVQVVMFSNSWVQIPQPTFCSKLPHPHTSIIHTSITGYACWFILGHFYPYGFYLFSASPAALHPNSLSASIHPNSHPYWSPVLPASRFYVWRSESTVPSLRFQFGSSSFALLLLLFHVYSSTSIAPRV